MVGVAFKQMVEEIGILYRSDHIQNGLINVLYGERCIATRTKNVPAISGPATTSTVTGMIHSDSNDVIGQIPLT